MAIAFGNLANGFRDSLQKNLGNAQLNSTPVFKQDMLGGAVGIVVEGSSPTRRLDLGLEVTSDFVDFGDTWDAAKNRVSDGVTWLRNGAVSMGQDGLNEAASSARDAGYETTADAMGALANAVGWFRGVYNQKPSRSVTGGLMGGRGAFLQARSTIPLNQIIKPLGLIVGMSFDFREPINAIGIHVEAGAALQLYNATISGISFEWSCDAGSCESVTDPKAVCADRDRHGLEPVLEYYKYHRISGADKDLTQTVLSLGKTQLRGWVVGMSAEPLNLDYRIWKWTIHLLISPEYISSPMMSADASSRLNFGAYTAPPAQ